jgi:hypothetical protein
MHTVHTTKEPVTLTMCIIGGGLFVLGKLIGGNKLTLPRIFSILEEGKRMMLSPLPGTPLSFTISPSTIHYPLPETQENENLIALYIKVTNPPAFIVTGKDGSSLATLN